MAEAPPRPLLEGYGEAGLRISGRLWREAVLVLPAGVQPLGARSLGEVAAAQLAPLLAAAAAIDLVLVGCGRRAAPAPEELRRSCRDAGLKLELLDTGAACRTYGLLAAEERRVAAILFPL